MSQIDEIADLIRQIQVLKNQLDETADNISKKAEENTTKLDDNFNNFETKIDSVLSKVKGLTRITNSHYWSVFGGGLFIGAALATTVTFSISNWFNKELITTRNEIKIEKETLTKELEAINKVKGNYKNFDKYIDLLNVLEKNNATIFTAKQFVKKTLLKDTEEQVVGIYFPMKALSNCGNGDSCYIKNDTNHAYNYFWLDKEHQVLHLTFKFK